jgi:hypothetical protein
VKVVLLAVIIIKTEDHHTVKQSLVQKQMNNEVECVSHEIQHVRSGIHWEINDSQHDPQQRIS